MSSFMLITSLVIIAATSILLILAVYCIVRDISKLYTTINMQGLRIQSLENDYSIVFSTLKQHAEAHAHMYDDFVKQMQIINKHAKLHDVIFFASDIPGDEGE